MRFFDIRNSVEIPDLPAESFDRKLTSVLYRYNIKTDRPAPSGKIIFTIPIFQFSSFKYRGLIFRGISLGEIEFFNHGESLVVRFNLALMPTRFLALTVVLLLTIISVFQNHYAPMIMGGWIVIVYFVVIDTARYRFKKWFSRFTK